MHIEVSEKPQKKSPLKSKKKKYILIISIIGFLATMAVGGYLLLAPAPAPVVTAPVVIPSIKIDMIWEIGVNPAAYEQHIIKLTHNGGDSISDMSKELLIYVNPPESTSYLRGTPVIHKSKYLELAEGDELYIYMGKDQQFYASKELPIYNDYIDFPNGHWLFKIEDRQYRKPVSEYDFDIYDSKTVIVNKNTQSSITEIIAASQPYDTIYITGDKVYHEQLMMDQKTVRLLGINNPIIDAGGFNSVLSLFNCSYGEVTGLTLENSGTSSTLESGILMESSDHMIIQNNTIRESQNGIYMLYSDDNIIRYNSVFNNDITGIMLTAGSDRNTIKSNDLQINTFGIYLMGAPNANYIVSNFGRGNSRYGILIDSKLNNIYEYNNFSYDKMSYDKVIEENMTVYDPERSVATTDWFWQCGPKESPYSPACLAANNR